MFYLMKRVLKTKKNNYKATLFKIVKDTLVVTMISIFFLFHSIFKSAKINEIKIHERNKDDWPKVDTGGELIWILSLLETLFFILGIILLFIAIVYFFIVLHRNFLLRKESILVKKLNGGDHFSLAFEFSVEQLVEISVSLIFGPLMASSLVNNLVSCNEFFLLYHLII